MTNLCGLFFSERRHFFRQVALCLLFKVIFVMYKLHVHVYIKMSHMHSDLWVQGSDDVGEGSRIPNAVRCCLGEGVFSDGPSRAVELTQSRQNVLQERRHVLGEMSE